MTTTGTVSWQSAFFGLAAIALNTITQPAGRVCGLSPASRFFVRASPIVCVVDTCQIFIHFFGAILRGETPAGAYRCVLSHRFKDIEAGDEDCIESARKTMLTRWIVFALSAATQLVKLYAMKGILWTQISASAYFVSWLTTEVVVVTAAITDGTSTELLMPHGTFRTTQHRRAVWEKIVYSEWVAIAALGCQGELNFLAVTISGALSVTKHGESLTKNAGVTLLMSFYLVGAAVAFMIAWHLMHVCTDNVQYRDSRGRITESAISVFITGLVAFGVLFQYLSWLFLEKESTSFGVKEVGLIILVAVILFELYAFPSFSGRTRSRLLWPPAWRIAFLMTTFSTGLACYVMRFNSTGTSKPKWTDLLG